MKEEYVICDQSLFCFLLKFSLKVETLKDFCF